MFLRSTTFIGLFALSTFTLEPRDASAHASVISVSPGNGTILDHAPERVLVRFSAGIISRSTQIDLEGPHGSSSLRIEGNGAEPTRELSIPVPDQGGGKYVVHWEIVSTDGERLAGKVRFSVKVDPGSR